MFILTLGKDEAVKIYGAIMFIMMQAPPQAERDEYDDKMYHAYRELLLSLEKQGLKTSMTVASLDL